MVIANVFEIHADGAGGPNGLRGCDRVIIAGFDVGGDRDVDGTGDARDHLDHFGAGDTLAVGVSERERNSGAGGSERWKSGTLKNLGAGYVPRIRQQQRFRSVMQSSQKIGLHTPILKGALENPPQACPSGGDESAMWLAQLDFRIGIGITTIRCNP